MADGTEGDVIVRRATRNDVDDVYKLVVELALATGMQHKVKSTAADFLTHGFGDEPDFHALVAETDKRIVGLCVFFYEFSTWLGKPGLYIQDLVVRDDVQRSGLGRRLIAETVRVAQERGANHLRLSVDVHNEDAIRFYEKIGMRVSGDECIYHAHDSAFRRLAELP